MPTTPPASRVLAAAVTGAATTAYYATPDLIRSRTARGWAKAGLAAVVMAVAVPELRRARATAAAERVRREQEARRALDAHAALQGGTDRANHVDPQTGAPPEDHVELRDVVENMSTRGKVVVATVGGAFLVGSVALTVATERWVFRRGEARRAAGKAWPHTRAALVWGLASGAMSLIPDPDPEPVTGDDADGPRADAA